MAKRMLIHDQGNLSNVPKLNRNLKLMHPKDDTSIAEALAAKIRILCWVITHPPNHDKLPVAIKDTWGRKCTKLVFLSTEHDESIPTVKLPVREGRDYLWGKMKAAIHYIYKNHRQDADWFLRTDDDTYVIMENLRYLLSNYDHRKPLYLGCRFRSHTPQGYMSGGAGMVLSRDALDRVVKRGLRATNLCDEGDEGDDDDAKIGICLHRVGVKAVDTRDSEQRGRFWPFSPQDHVVPYTDPDFWYWRYTYYPSQYGVDCCSDYSISFHYQSPADMYTMEFLIYKLRPFGIQYSSGRLPKILKNSKNLTNITNWKTT
ncbi:glycoprotein-N-acetylgalactosamine 3-beta-galactosyltransferase 1-like [Hyposmocoma kahamanoa]|uniref:glycoprotein-N-acetylgalactosamine 3-beta-galactosyltransferase 1-like n=1 Tax=Hyposmocoma kahamanoa TaxID=1477025 RepID=UPI000E6D612E|nr:glycoprotein-N-acetylgalactosamine 3-beta-galactosyltransferase 1-like [Hyposmocoma kahamanoa]